MLPTRDELADVAERAFKEMPIGPCQILLYHGGPCGNPAKMHPELGLRVCGVCGTVPYVIFRYSQPWDGTNPENWA